MGTRRHRCHIYQTGTLRLRVESDLRAASLPNCPGRVQAQLCPCQGPRSSSLSCVLRGVYLEHPTVSLQILWGINKGQVVLFEIYHNIHYTAFTEAISILFWNKFPDPEFAIVFFLSREGHSIMCWAAKVSSSQI